MTMFLNKNYILGNELVEKMEISIANISNLRKKFENNNDLDTIVKIGNCSFINSVSKKLPTNIKFGIRSNIFTNVSDKLPVTWVNKEFNSNEEELQDCGIVIDTCKISGKQFYIFEPKFVKEMKGRIGYILDKEETFQCYEKNQIKGYIELSKNKYFTWY